MFKINFLFSKTNTDRTKLSLLLVSVSLVSILFKEIWKKCFEKCCVVNKLVIYSSNKGFYQFTLVIFDCQKLISNLRFIYFF